MTKRKPPAFNSKTISDVTGWRGQMLKNVLDALGIEPLGQGALKTVDFVNLMDLALAAELVRDHRLTARAALKLAQQVSSSDWQGIFDRLATTPTFLVVDREPSGALSPRLVIGEQAMLEDTQRVIAQGLQGKTLPLFVIVSAIAKNVLAKMPAAVKAGLAELAQEFERAEREREKPKTQVREPA
jgi:hypothetical protein